MAKDEHPEDTLIEEVVNTLTHGVGAVLSMVGLGVLIWLAATNGGAAVIASAVVYGAALVILYLSSTLYHGTWHGGAKRILLAVDHCAIFLLIAGTYTPIAMLTMPLSFGLPLVLAVWLLALVGIVLRLCVGRLFDRISTMLYLAIGWLGIVWAGPLVKGLGAGGSLLLLAGGLSYTAGVPFYAWRRLRFNHAIWHVFVLTGSALHFFAIALYVLPAVA